MNTEAKNEELLDLCRRLKYSQRIVFSDEGNLASPSKVWEEDQDLCAQNKPQGLWYSIGPAWISFLTNGFKDQGSTWEKKRLAWITHVYKLSLRRRTIYSIQTEQEFDVFCSRYARKDHRAVRWYKMASDGWDGIEIRFLPDRDDVYWYNGWDCSSGCIWNPEAIRSIRLLAAWQHSWKKEIL